MKGHAFSKYIQFGCRSQSSFFIRKLWKPPVPIQASKRKMFLLFSPPRKHFRKSSSYRCPLLIRKPYAKFKVHNLCGLDRPSRGKISHFDPPRINWKQSIMMSTPDCNSHTKFQIPRLSRPKRQGVDFPFLTLPVGFS